MVHIDSDLIGELFKPFLDLQVPGSRRMAHAFTDHAHFTKAIHDMLIENSVTGKTDVPQEVARFFIPQAHDRFVLRKKITAGIPAIQGL